MKMRFAAIHLEDEIRLLDHIAPLCDLLQMPLFFSEKRLETLLQRYYPTVERFLLASPSLPLEFFAKNFDALFQCRFWDPSLPFLFSRLHQKPMKLIFCSHGNSDKGHKAKALIEGYTWQPMSLLYGEHMVDRLKATGILERMHAWILIGNYRARFYQKYKTSLDQIVEQEVFSRFSSQKKTLLYAPTWNDVEDSSSFFLMAEKLIDQLPKEYNLIIKPHPLLQEKEATRFYSLLKKENPFAIFLTDFPLIYPLLSRVEALFGDFSSIGYDFLSFEKPMIFFNPLGRASFDPSLFLHRCGISVSKKEYSHIYSSIESFLHHWPEKYKEKQREISLYAFGKKPKTGALLRKELESL